MAIKTASVAITTGTPALLSTHSPGSGRSASFIQVTNTGSNPIYLGGSDVTSSTGVELAAGATSPQYTLVADDELYAVTGTSTSTAQVMQLGVE